MMTRDQVRQISLPASANVTVAMLSIVTLLYFQAITTVPTIKLVVLNNQLLFSPTLIQL